MSYQYDSSGNVVSSVDLANQQSSFSAGNNSIAKLVNPDGTSYEYAYDGKKNVTKARSSEGAQYSFTYDSAGNPLTSRISGDGTSTSVIPGRQYYIRSRLSGKYLSITGSFGTWEEVGQYQFTGDGGQKWLVQSTPEGGYKLVIQNGSGRVLDLDSGHTEDGANILAYTDSETKNQRFQIYANEDGTYKIATNTSENSVLDVQNISVENGANVQQWHYTGTDNQKWYFEPVTQNLSAEPKDGSIYMIRSRHSGQYVDVRSWVDAAGAVLQQYPYNGGNHQYFRLSDAGDGYFRLAPLHSTTGKVISVREADFSVTLADAAESDSQKFRFIRNSDGTYQIQSKGSGRTLDLDGYSYTPEMTVHFTPYSGQTNQQWVLETASLAITASAAYTADGNYLSSMTDARGNTAQYQYDTVKGTLSNVTDAKGNRTQYAYGAGNDRFTEAGASVGGKTVSSRYSYANDQLSAITHNGFEYGFSYDDFGNIVGVSVGGTALITNRYDLGNGLLNGFTYGNGQEVSYTYDDGDRLVQTAVDGTARFRYVYDNDGNLSAATDLLTGTTQQNTYDLIGRLIRTDGSNGHSTLYGYDSKNRSNLLTNILQGITTKQNLLTGMRPIQLKSRG